MNKPVEDLREYRTHGLTLLQLMGVLGTLGVVVAVVLTFFF